MPGRHKILIRMQQNTAVIVLGMHRSGTSALAGTLQRLGLDLGDGLMPANAENERGFFEHLEIVDIHDRLLATLDSSWDDPNSLEPGWVERPEVEPYRPWAASMMG